MSNTSISPNMGLIIPTVGTDPGPDWANNLNASFTLVDQHNHAFGNGVQITPNGLNINSDLTFLGNNGTNFRSLRLLPQTAPLSLPTDIGCLYESGADLYYNDGNGVQIQITKQGAVFASSSGISNGTATASFSNSVLVVNSASNTPANIQGASLLLGNNVTNSKYLTVQPPTGMTNNYSITLPSNNTSGGTVLLEYDTNNNIIQSTSTSLVGFNPPGAVIMYAGTSTPTGYLRCDGTVYSRTTYSTLFTAISTSYGIGDGSTTFNVPDMRGMFPRGVDEGSGNDPDSGSRSNSYGGNTGDNVGSIQGWQYQEHGHPLAISNTAGGQISGVAGSVTGFPPIYDTPNAIQISGGNQTNPINTYFYFIIKY